MREELKIEKTNEIIAKVKKEVDRVKLPEDVKRSKKEGTAFDVDRIEISEDGSLKTYIKGKPEPLLGFAETNTVLLVSCLKMIFPRVLKNIKKMGWIGRICTLIAIKNNLNLFSNVLASFFQQNAILLKDIHWCRPVKEIRRVLKGRINDDFIDLISVIIEFDSAYRYRMQDVIIYLDQHKLKNTISMVREINRLCQILISREPGEKSWMKEKFALMGEFSKLLYFIPKTAKIIREILKDLNLKELRMGKEDIFWTNTFSVYKYRGLPLEERLKQNLAIYGVEK